MVPQRVGVLPRALLRTKERGTPDHAVRGVGIAVALQPETPTTVPRHHPCIPRRANPCENNTVGISSSKDESSSALIGDSSTPHEGSLSRLLYEKSCSDVCMLLLDRLANDQCCLLLLASYQKGI